MDFNIESPKSLTDTSLEQYVFQSSRLYNYFDLTFSRFPLYKFLLSYRMCQHSIPITQLVRRIFDIDQGKHSQKHSQHSVWRQFYLPTYWCYDYLVQDQYFLAIVHALEIKYLIILEVPPKSQLKWYNPTCWIIYSPPPVLNHQ